ncbi:hypothetical protein MBLNU230_g1522t1 [Neophaeotheca triangularis]
MAELGVSGVDVNQLYKLQGRETFDKWYDAVRDHLLERRLYKIVTGERARPQKEDFVEAGKTRWEQDEAFEEADETWLSKDAWAKIILRTTVSNNVYSGLRRKETAHDMWSYLSFMYKPEGPSHEMGAWHRFVDCRFDGVDIAAFCRSYRKCLRDMKDIGIEFEEKLALYQFVDCIDDYYPQFTANLLNQLRTAKRNSNEWFPDLDTVMRDVCSSSSS